MSAELKNFSTLFTETWALFKTRALTILGVLLLTSLFIIVGILVVGVAGAMFLGGGMAAFEQLQQGKIDAAAMLAVGVFSLVVMVVALWSQSATIAAAVDDNLGVRAALRVGWQRLWPMAWILGLAGSIIMAGFMLFMVPGLIFCVSLMFALYPLYTEDLRGMDAIMASRRYVKGRWWNTCGKLLLIWLIAIVLDLIPLVGPFLYLFFTPFLLLFLVAMYRDLKETAEEVPADERRGLWWLLAVAGMLLPVLGIIAAVAIPQFAAFNQRQQQMMHEETPMPAPQVIPQAIQKQNENRAGENTDIPVTRAVYEGQWRDPIGDVAEFGVGRWMDINTVSVRSASGLLVINVQTKLPLTAAFNAASTTSQSFYRFATLYFDTDVDRQTGGNTGEKAGRSGYDYGLDITLEAPRNEPEKGQVHVSLFRFENGLRRFLGPLPDGQVRVLGDTIRLQLPYESLALQAGSQVRISFLEAFQEQGSGLSKDKIIDLK